MRVWEAEKLGGGEVSMMDGQNHIKKAVFNIFDFIVSVFYWFSFVLMLILSGVLAGYLHCLS